MHFLLDTNLFIDFVKDAKEEHFFEHIIKLAEEGAIQILVPDILMSEWEEKKEQTLLFIDRTFKSTITLSKNDSTAALLRNNYNYSKSKAALVDKLLNNGLLIKTPSKVKSDTVDRSLSHKAPFHDRKTKTINDAVIFFSAIYYLKKNKISKLVFITKDGGDFGEPSCKNEVLHHQLEDPLIEIKYFTTLYKCFDTLKSELKIKQPDREGLFQLIISKRNNKNLLDHLFDVLKTFKSKINFLPTFLLSRIEPFRVIDIRHDYSYHTGDTLLTNNKELISFFKEVDIRKLQFKKGSQYRNSKINKQKLEYIITSLNENMVFHISYITGSDRIHLHRDINDICPCAVCTYRSLSFSKLMSEIHLEQDESKRAFILFQLGKFNESLSVYYNIYKNAVREENHILAYRISLTIHWVLNFAESQIDALPDEHKEVVINAKKIDRDDTFRMALNGTKLDREIALFLHGDGMFDHFKLEMKDRVEEIRQHYQSQLKASYSSNSNLQNLNSAFLNFELFTVCNGMPYTRYSDFQGICDDFVEGILLCCSLNHYQSSRIEHLDDFILERLLLYGKADKMILQFNRYLKHRVPYKSDSRDFERMALNFLNSSEATIDQFSSPGFSEGSHSFYKIFWNLLLLLSIVDFDESFIALCTKQFFKFLKKLPKRETHQLNHLASFIHTKGKLIKNDLLNDLFLFIIKSPHLHSEDLFEQFSSIEDYQFKLKLTGSGFEEISKFLFTKCEKCGEFHKNVLFYTYSLLPSKYQAIVTKKINILLSDSFDADLYYLSVMGNAIDHKPFFNQYLNLFKPIRKSDNSYYHMNGEIHFRYLNNLLNLVFKTNATLSTDFVNQFKGLTDYYDWVFDMENFDYSKFSPLWIIQYPTKYYLRKAFSIKNVKDKVRRYVRENNQPTLAYYFTQWVQ